MRLASADVAAPFVSDVLARDGLAWVRESSGSMAPLIRPGDRLQLVPIDRDRLQQGDLVAYRRGPHLIVHRVVVRQRDGVITKGDALPHPDTPLPWDVLVGRVVRVAHADGRVHDLTAVPWPAVGRLVARLSRLGEAFAAPPDGGWRRAGWALLRLPVHLCAWLLR